MASLSSNLVEELHCATTSTHRSTCFGRGKASCPKSKLPNCEVVWDRQLTDPAIQLSAQVSNLSWPHQVNTHSILQPSCGHSHAQWCSPDPDASIGTVAPPTLVVDHLFPSHRCAERTLCGSVQGTAGPKRRFNVCSTAPMHGMAW